MLWCLIFGKSTNPFACWWLLHVTSEKRAPLPKIIGIVLVSCSNVKIYRVRIRVLSRKVEKLRRSRLEPLFHKLSYCWWSCVAVGTKYSNDQYNCLEMLLSCHKSAPRFFTLLHPPPHRWWRQTQCQYEAWRHRALLPDLISAGIPLLYIFPSSHILECHD